MKPDFFRYAMTDVSPASFTSRDALTLKMPPHKHGGCRLGMKDAVIVLKPASGSRAGSRTFGGDGLLPDEEFLHALHPALRRGLEPLQFRKPLHVETKLVLDAPAAPGEATKIWWDGGASLHQQAFQAGVEINDVEGVIWCHGHYNGHQLERIERTCRPRTGHRPRPAVHPTAWPHRGGAGDAGHVIPLRPQGQPVRRLCRRRGAFYVRRTNALRGEARCAECTARSSSASTTSSVPTPSCKDQPALLAFDRRRHRAERIEG